MDDNSGNEVWFDKWLWSYMPCHWKGWAFLGCLVWFVLSVIGLIEVLHWPYEDIGIPLTIIGAVIFGSRVAERHSRRRR